MNRWKQLLIAATVLSAAPIALHAQWVPTNGPYCGGSVEFMTLRGRTLIACVVAPMVSRPNLVPAAVFESSDLGASWKEVLRLTPETRFTSLVSSGRDLLVGTMHDVYRSTDNGRTWIRPDTSMRRFWITAIGAMNSAGKKRFFMAARQHGIFVSTDEGASWWKSGSAFTAGGAISLAVSGRTIFAATDTGVLASSDYGKSWHRSGLNYIGVNRLAVSGSGVIYAGNYSALYYSTDEGRNWMVANNPTRGRPPVLVSASGNKLFVTAVRSLYVSSDRGRSWKAFGLNKGWVTAMTAEGKYMFAATGMDGIYRSGDGGATWEAVNDGLLKAGVDHLASSGKMIYAGTKGFGIYRSADGGRSWSKLDLGLGVVYFPRNYITALSADGNDVCAKSWEYLFHSTDEGRTWGKVEIPGRYGRGFASPLALRGDTILVSNQQTLIRSTDGGKSWQLADSGLGLSGNRPPVPGQRVVRTIVEYSRIAPAAARPAFVVRHPPATRPRVIRNVGAIGYDGTKIYAGVTGGCVYLSTDGGGFWTELDSNITTKLFNEIAHIGGELYAATEGDGMLRSTDGGEFWEKVNNGFTDFDSHVIVSSGRALFVGAGNGVYYSGDRGDHWTMVNDGLVDSVIIGLTVHDGYVYAGTWDYGVWKRKISDIIAAVKKEKRPAAAGEMKSEN